LLQKQNGTKCLLTVSTIPSEGKTFVAACLSGILAQETGKAVLLIHADMRTLAGSKLFGLQAREPLVGLSDVLQGVTSVDDALLKCSELNLSLLPCGRTVQNPTDLLSGPAFENLLRDVTQRFDWVIVDSPPMLALADASLMLPLCDAALMVVHAEKTP